MSEDVKPKRRYRSDRRREQAAQTRLRVLDAARERFVAAGFAGTTIASVAEAAGVSPETIYGTFGNKAALLKQVVRTAARGGDVTPILEQAGPRSVAAATDQHEQLRLFAQDVTQRLERAGPVFAVLTAAVPGEPALAEAQAQIDGLRRANLSHLIEQLAANQPLAVTNEVALDTVWALASPELFQLLTTRGGWPSARYAAWLGDTLSAALLDTT
jgi:AcrR family transcriptional regulator